MFNEALAKLMATMEAPIWEKFTAIEESIKRVDEKIDVIDKKVRIVESL